MSFVSVWRAPRTEAFAVRLHFRRWWLIGLFGAVTSVQAEPKLMGYFYEGAKPVLSLADADGANARWVDLGGSFDGYRIEAFDKEAGKLTLSRDGRRIEIRLNVARVRDARTEQLARLRSLTGIARAQELARTGDAKLGDLLIRRQQVLDSPDQGQKSKYALEFLNKRIEELAAERIAELEKQVTAASSGKAASP